MSTANSPKSDGKHVLSLRVVKIPMPSFKPLVNATVDPFELPQFLSLSKNGLNQYDVISSIDDMKVDSSNYFNDIISIPQNQNSITFGETFQFYLQCSNDSEHNVYNISFYIEFRSSKGKKFTLVNTSDSPLQELEPNKTIDYSFHYRVEDPMFYYLSCKVNYTMGTGKNMILKKMFKLQVNTAFNPRINVQPFGNDGVIVVADIMNLISTPLYIESVKLITNGNFYSSTNLNYDNNQSPYDPSHIHDLLLYPNDSKLFAFHIKKQNMKQETNEYNQNVGHLTITWRNHFGEIGYQRSDEIHMISFAKVNPIHISIKEIPKIKMYEPFKVIFTIHNNTDKSIQPNIKPLVQYESNIKVYGRSRLQLPKIKKNASHQFEMEFIALESGIQNIGGLVLTDTKRMKVYNYKTIKEVIVEAP